MKLFVWQGDGVLTDYTNGTIVAIADDLESAVQAIQKVCSYADSNYPHSPSEVVDLGPSTTEPRAWVCWGGG